MKNQLCADCGLVFEYPKSVKDANGEWWGECPHCRSDNFEDAERCTLCNHYAWTRNLEDGLCTSCQKLTDEIWRDQIQPMIDLLFTENQKKYLQSRAEHEEFFIGGK